MLPPPPSSPLFPYTTLFRSDAWNFFDDLTGLHAAPGTEYAQLSRAAAACYDKLFWGNNLPSVTPPGERLFPQDRKSTRLNSSHRCISYAVFCLKKKKKYYKT